MERYIKQELTPYLLNDLTITTAQVTIAMANYNSNLIPFGPWANCTLDLCPLEISVFRYLPNIPANATFLAVFGVLLILHVVQGARHKTWAYMGCIVAGCVLEIAGYVGRIMLHDDPFDFNAFLVNLGNTPGPSAAQRTQLTERSTHNHCPYLLLCSYLCPVDTSVCTQLSLSYSIALLAFLNNAASITHTDRSISRLNPRFITFTFIPCDIISLVLQGAGGALSAGASTVDGTKIGVDVSKAGLIFQVITLVLFIGLSTDYLVALRKSHQKRGISLEKLMKLVIVWLGVATVLILVRCIFRIYELKDGYFAPAFRDEGTFIAFESV